MADLAFPTSLPEFQRLFPNDDACAAYLYGVRWRDGFVCPTCAAPGEPYRFAGKPALLRCRACKRNTSVTVGTVMERTHSDLSTWFCLSLGTWATIAPLVGRLIAWPGLRGTWRCDTV